MTQAKMLAEAICPGMAIGDGNYTGCDTKGGTLKDCPNCQGTGLKYPGLSRECKSRHGWAHPIGDAISNLCHKCHGSGRVEAVTLEAVMDAAAQTEWSIDFNPPTHTRSEKWECSFDNGARTIEACGETPLEAATAALAQMEEK